MINRNVLLKGAKRAWCYLPFGLREVIYKLRIGLKKTLSRNKVNYSHWNLGIASKNCYISFDQSFALSRYGDNLFHYRRWVQSKFRLLILRFYSKPFITVFVSLQVLDRYASLLNEVKNLKNVTYVIDSFDQPVIRRPNFIKESSVWYSSNLIYPSGPKGFLLPLGVERESWAKFGTPHLFEYSQSHGGGRILVGPFKLTHPTRATLLSKNDNHNVKVLRDRLSPEQYAEVCKSFDFVVCPPGRGIDTYRFWETLYRGRIPIVMASTFSEQLSSLGLPLIAIDNLEEVWEWTSEKCLSLAEELRFVPSQIEHLNPQHWIQKLHL